MNHRRYKPLNIWRALFIIAAISAIVVVGVKAFCWLNRHQDYDETHVQQTVKTSSIPPKPELQLYKPLLPEQAIKENDQIPFSDGLIERAIPLVLPPAQLHSFSERSAIDCLTSAIYYEAGNESGQGQRAVAQVVLNRARHPAFPKSICGVVYQGSERKTGCQFTFTCDGSLSRQPNRKLWDKARMVAIGAISGAVEPSVGMATHYHANYVLPYWAPSLDKISRIGTHIFYRWKGSWGRRRAFSQIIRMNDDNVQPQIRETIVPDLPEMFPVSEIPLQAPSGIYADDILPVGLIASPSALKGPLLRPIMRADQMRSTLTVDEQKSTLKQR